MSQIKAEHSIGSKVNTAVLIPSLSPDKRLVQVVKDTFDTGFLKVLVVNDGSAESYHEIFEQVRELGATVINHAVNLGKGRALKTGLNFIINEWKDCTGVITADSDGQHRVEDMLLLADSLSKHPEALILGCREFTGGQIPFRSRFGNHITAKVMKLLVGVSISDTQTGLRAFSVERMKQFLPIKGERFEYEMNMLLYAKEESIPFEEVKIKTIYLEENKSSHFNPLVDSMKIYALFLKYIFASLSSFVVDIFLFTVFVMLLQPIAEKTYILQSTVLARVLSSMANFFLNRTGVFKSKDNLRRTLLRYYTLAVVQMLTSAGLVWLFHSLIGGNESVIKVVVDCLLFFVSFNIQREWVFQGRKSRNSVDKKS